MKKTRISLHLAQRLMNTPLAVHGQYLKTMIGALQGRGLPVLQMLDGEQTLNGRDLSAMASDYLDTHTPKVGAWDDDDYRPREHCPYALMGDIAVIRLDGSLVHKYGHLEPYSGMTGYDGIRQCIDMALADPKVRAIALDCDSPGGEVAGCFALGDYIYSQVRGRKPIWALVNELAASACFAIAAACDQIHITETASAGSVGVICAHTDASKAVANAGFNVTLFYSGVHKADYNSYAPLSDALSAELQAEMVALHQLFAAKVALWRGLDVTKVLATESRLFRGHAAVDVGLVDAVTSPDDFYRNLTAATRSQPTGDTTTMTNAPQITAASLALTAAAPAMTPAALDNAQDTNQSADFATAERERVMGILGLDEAKSRPNLAQKLAMTPNLSVEQAKGFLAAAAAEPSATAGTLNSLMATHAAAPLTEESGNPVTSAVDAACSLMERAFGKGKKS